MLIDSLNCELIEADSQLASRGQRGIARDAGGWAPGGSERCVL